MSRRKQSAPSHKEGVTRKASMDTSEHNLTNGVTATLHAPLGEDEMRQWAIITKVDTSRYAGTFDETWLTIITERFALCMALTDKIDGTDFEIPSARDNKAVITDAFIRWMKLPKSVFSAWQSAAVNMDKTLNAPELLPANKVGEKALTDPLSSSSD